MLAGKAYRRDGVAKMIRRFLNDVHGNFAIMTSIALVPIIGAVALAVDYAQMSRQRQDTLNALDAAGIATARYIQSASFREGDQGKAIEFAQSFFSANLGSVAESNARLNVILPDGTPTGGTLKLSADLTYRPYFFSAFARMMGTGGANTEKLAIDASIEVQLKNTLEVALVLDNSGSMAYTGKGTGKPRLTLLKSAAKQLVDTLGAEAAMLQQVPEPVRFAVVPFAASVNVGPTTPGLREDRAWLDTEGISPVHHENFDWSKMMRDNGNKLYDPNKYVEFVQGAYRKSGKDWGKSEGEFLTRFSLYEDIKVKTKAGGSEQYEAWAGCVEARPAPYGANDAAPSRSNPATLFVPMFAPDEPGNLWNEKRADATDNSPTQSYGSANNWWTDWEDKSGYAVKLRQRDMRKYFRAKPYGLKAIASNLGPNYSCTTTPITPLNDVTVVAGKKTVLDAIDAMEANGATNVPEGAVWGWHAVSSGEPFSKGRPETERGNSKIVIVLTDGANTYYPANGSDSVGNKSTYAAYGYTGQLYEPSGVPRLFMQTGASPYDHWSSNFQKGLDDRLQQVCNNAKGANVMMVTVSLDLDPVKDKVSIDALRECASESRYTAGKGGEPSKLYFEATGANLAETFKKIADELSNLRIAR